MEKSFEVEPPRERGNTDQLPSSSATFSSRSSVSRASVGTPLLASHAAPEGITQLQATLSLMTCIIGAGIMALPQLPTRGGWALSTCFMCISCGAIAIAGVDGMWQASMDYNKGKAANEKILSYEDLGRQAFGRRGELLVFVTVTIWFIGVLAGYTILVAQQFEAMSRMFNFPISQQLWTFIIFLPFLGLAMMRDMAAIAKIVPLGILGAICSCCIICIKATSDAYIWQDFSDAQLEGNSIHQMWPASPLALGSVIATLFGAFGVNANVPAVLSEMKNPAEFPCALRTALFTVLVLYLCIMLCGHYGYGNFVQGNILISMERAPANGTEAFAEFDGGNLKWCHWTGPCGWQFSFAMQLAVLANLIISFPLNMMTIIQSLQTLDGLADKFPVGSLRNYIMRSSLVILVFAVALIVPTFNVVFAFFASYCGPTLQTIYPIWLGHKVVGMASGSKVRLSMVKIAIIVFAIVCIVLGLIDSTSQLVATINPSEACEKEFGHCGSDGSHYILND